MQSGAMLPKLSETTQTISFSQGDGVYSSEVFANNVVVTTNAGSHNHGSSKMKLKNLVDYNWEPKFYSGQLLALHMSGKYLAYSIKSTNNINPGTWNGMVRVVYNPEPGTDIRSLIRGVRGEVQDLAFAHISNQVILSCIDEHGNIYVYDIIAVDSVLRHTLLAEVREDTGLAGTVHRVVWCPYIPDVDDDAHDDDVARLLLTTHGNTGRVWNIRFVEELARRGDVAGAVSAEAALAAGAFHTAAEHDAPIVDGAFSPDGTALATASADGYVLFYKVYDQCETSSQCLHKWQPHGGAPLSCLFFLDNFDTSTNDVQFWKYAVTGAENNSILKIWSCKTWSCHQTITFAPSIGADTSLALKATLDKSAKYLVVSEQKSRCLYVLQLQTTDSEAYCAGISEFLLPFPVLCFILRAEEQPPKCESSCSDPFHTNGSGGDIGVSPIDYDLHRDDSSPDMDGSCTPGAVRLRLYIVQPKGLQEAVLTYMSPVSQLSITNMDSTENLGIEDMRLGETSETTMALSSILQQQSQQLKNLLMRGQTQPGSLIGQRVESPTLQPALNLMTPDAFSSPGKRDEDDPPLSSTPDVQSTHRTSLAASNNGYQEELEQQPTAAEMQKFSAGSSPSREVQEIMSLSDEFYKDNQDEPEVPDDQTDAEVDQNGEIETTWPQISIAQINEANQRKASTDNYNGQSAGQSLNVSNNSEGIIAEVQEIVAQVKPVGLCAEDRGRLEALEHKIDKLTELLSQQSRELRSLRSEVSDPREMIEQAVQAHNVRTTTAIQNALSEGWERVMLMSETSSRSAAQAAGRGAAAALEPLAASLRTELASKLSATDQLLRENLDKLVTSKTVMEKLTASVSSTLSELVRGWFRDSLGATVLPAIEKSHAHMFRQLNIAFQQGTKEFASNTETLARTAAERGASSVIAPLHVALERHTEALAAASSNNTQQQLVTLIGDTTKTVLEKELSWWRSEARSVVAEMSRAHSPAPSVLQTSAKERQMQVIQVQQMINGGDINGAFQLALSASDLALVMCACRAAEPARVFGPPCALKQHVLLSLVQQLAADMTHDTQLKHRYLEEAILNMDTNNPVTREHLPVVVRELKKQVAAFVSAHPTHALLRPLRMLNMAADSLLAAL